MQNDRWTPFDDTLAAKWVGLDILLLSFNGCDRVPVDHVMLSGQPCIDCGRQYLPLGH